MIHVCSKCDPDGMILVPVSLYETKRTFCPNCHGIKMWRDPPDDFTKLENLPPNVIKEMATIHPWIRIYDEGKIQFISGPGLPQDDDVLLDLLKSTGRLGKILAEEHNWIVRY